MYIYFIQSHPTKYVKIGKAANPETRLKELQTGCPEYLHLIGKVKTNAAGKLERALHRSFEADRTSGEWFLWSPRLQSLLEYLTKYPSIMLGSLPAL